MRKKYKLIDTFENKVLGTGTFKELSREFNIGIDHIKWSYYHKTIILKRYLVKKTGGMKGTYEQIKH